MKITTNMVGNYFPNIAKNPVKKLNSQKTAKTNETNAAVKAKKENLNMDEKKYFSKLYPDNKSEIMDYHFYQKSGKMSGVKIGSLFDMKG